MTDITVPVPEERIAEFYQFFGLWLASSLSVEDFQASGNPSEEPMKPWGNTAEDLTDATTLWPKYSTAAKDFFSLLIDNPGREFTGDEIARAIGLHNGARGAAGVLAWPGRYGYAIRRGLPSLWHEAPETFIGHYYLTDERAELFRAARAAAQ